MAARIMIVAAPLIGSENLKFSLPTPSVSHSYQVQLIAQGRRHSPAVLSLIAAAVADSTRRAYNRDLEDFQQWGGSVPCTPDVLASYIADRALALSPHTIARRVVGISRAHVSRGLTDPAKHELVRTVLRGLRRRHGTPQRQVAPLLTHDIAAILPVMQGSKGIRDRALILLGFAAALRRSELVALDADNLQSVKEGLLVHLRRSKTDQHGHGREIAIPYGHSQLCPVKAVECWCEHAKIISGPLFRPIGRGGAIAPTRLTAQSVALILKRYATAAGLNATNISGHSLRSGFITSAALAGVPVNKIQQQSGHRSLDMLARYIRDGTPFENNAAGQLL